MPALKEKINWLTQGLRYFFAYASLLKRVLLPGAILLLIILFVISLIGFIYSNHPLALLNVFLSLFWCCFSVHAMAYTGHQKKKWNW